MALCPVLQSLSVKRKKTKNRNAKPVLSLDKYMSVHLRTPLGTLRIHQSSSSLPPNPMHNPQSTHTLIILLPLP